MIPLLIICILMVDPLTFSKRTPFFFSMPVAYSSYYNLFLSVNEGINTQVLPQTTDQSLPPNVITTTTILILFLTTFQEGVATQLVGLRVGNVPSFVQRVVYFPILVLINLLILVLPKIFILNSR